MALKVDIEKRDGGTCVVKLEGRLDTDTYLECQQKIKPLFTASTKVLMFDMSNLSYISSAGVSTIFSAKKSIEANKGTFMMVNLQPQIKKVFEIIKALPDESIFGSIEEADNYLDAMQRKEIEKEKGETS